MFYGWTGYGILIANMKLLTKNMTGRNHLILQQCLLSLLIFNSVALLAFIRYEFVNAQGSEPSDDEVNQIASQLYCPICENVPLDEDIYTFFKREVLPYRPGAWIDETKTKVGYEIPFTRMFYEYAELEPSREIAKRIEQRERNLIEKLQVLFGNGGVQNG